ncbi:MAG: 4-hydroxy-tetrahydrodipicolinate reductase [Pseudobdellovibrio sp.]
MNPKIKIGLLGSQGKMGLSIRQLLKFEEQIHPFIEIAKRPSDEFTLSYKSIHEVSVETLKAVDVWIDFSRPEGLDDLIDVLAKTKSAVVSGTTGLGDIQINKLKKLSAKNAVFWASNMSVGLWTVRQTLKSLKSISHFDFAIDEIHHTQKKDNPSGTAITLHQDLELATGKKIPLPRGHRLGGIFGIHTITAASQSEMIKIEHNALNRSVFAEGAIKAAVWIFRKNAGLYSMDDLMSSGVKTQRKDLGKQKKTVVQKTKQKQNKK